MFKAKTPQILVAIAAGVVLGLVARHFKGPAYSRCGPASLYAALKLSGRVHSYEDVLSKFPKEQGPQESMEVIASASQKLGYEYVPVRGKIETLRSLRYPAVLHLSRGHFVTLVSSARSGANIIDLQKDRAFRSHHFSFDHISRVWSGFMLVDRRDYR